MLAQELEVLDADSPLWEQGRPLLNAALLLEQQNDRFVWHGWTKQQIVQFLAGLPSPCCLVVGVWETETQQERAIGGERLVLGLICEVVAGEVRSLRTFEALRAAGLRAVDELEPGYEDGIAIMRAAHALVAPVAWALFTDRRTWYEWVLSEAEPGMALDKGEALAALARQGRCVLMGNRTTHLYG